MVKKRLQSDASSKFDGNTSPYPHGFGTSRSIRTIENFLDIGGRDEVDAKVVRCLYVCGIYWRNFYFRHTSSVGVID
jgi:hypothetical protein